MIYTAIDNVFDITLAVMWQMVITELSGSFLLGCGISLGILRSLSRWG